MFIMIILVSNGQSLLVKLLQNRLVVAVVVFTFAFNRPFSSTASAVHPVSVLIIHPRELQIM